MIEKRYWMVQKLNTAQGIITLPACHFNRAECGHWKWKCCISEQGMSGHWGQQEGGPGTPRKSCDRTPREQRRVWNSTWRGGGSPGRLCKGMSHEWHMEMLIVGGGVLAIAEGEATYLICFLTLHEFTNHFYYIYSNTKSQLTVEPV